MAPASSAPTAPAPMGNSRSCPPICRPDRWGRCPPRPPRGRLSLGVTGTRRTSALAVAAAICGLIPILPATLAALVLGIAARRQIRRTGEDGIAFANTALALGAFWIAATLIVLLLVH